MGEGSNAWSFPENNNRMTAFQRSGGDSSKEGQVSLEYFAHSSFRITSPGGMTIVIDPWRNDPSGAWGQWFPEEYPEIYADIVLSTHAHFDHDAVHRVHAAVTLERPVGIFSVGDVKIEGLGDKHMFHAKGSYRWKDVFAESGIPTPPGNPMHLDNSIIVVETGGMRIAHWGDNRPEPDEYVMGRLRGIDVLTLPIDGSEHILTAEDIAGLIDRLEPKVVIPMHYRIQGVVTVLSTLQTPDAWLDMMPAVIRHTEARWTFHRADIARYRRQAFSFGNQYVRK